MSPINITNPVSAFGEIYSSVLIGPIEYVVPILVDPSVFKSTSFVDTRGWLKPGTPLKVDGTVVSAGSQVIYGVVIEAQKIATSNSDAALDAVAPFMLPVVVVGVVNRDLLEDNLGRVVSADEISAFGASKGLFLTASLGGGS
jgi:hypothetical protein